MEKTEIIGTVTVSLVVIYESKGRELHTDLRMNTGRNSYSPWKWTWWLEFKS